jgi:hypothetical protein
VGVDTCSPVGPYPNHFPFQGEIEWVVIDLRSDLAEEDINSQKEGQERAARAIQ